MDVKGLSIQDILSFDYNTLVNKLNDKQIRQITNRLVSASNKRIRRLGKSELGMKSPAYHSFERRGRFFSVKGKNRNEVLKEFSKASRFLQLKTSTLSGWKNVIKKGKQQLKEQYGVDVSYERIADVFSTLHKAQETGQVGGRGTKGSETARDVIFDIIKDNPNIDNESLLQELDSRYTEQYEQEQEDENEEDKNNGIFII